MALGRGALCRGKRLAYARVCRSAATPLLQGDTAQAPASRFQPASCRAADSSNISYVNQWLERSQQAYEALTTGGGGQVHEPR